jgi:hypothetical protein
MTFGILICGGFLLLLAVGFLCAWNVVEEQRQEDWLDAQDENGG